MGVIKNMVKNWLEINEPDSLNIKIDKLADFEGQSFINNVWYRGEASELDQLYKQLDDKMGNRHFWASAPVNTNMRKIHTGLPAMIIDTLSDICVDDLSSIDVKNRQQEWNDMDKEIHLKDLLDDALKGVLVDGDGVVKISIDTAVSKYPIVEFYEGHRVDFEYTRGRITAYIFKTQKRLNHKNYTLLERYTKSGVSFKLIDSSGKEEDISKFSELSEYKDCENRNNFMMAIPIMIYKSKKYKGRGKSLFDGKVDNFDAYDEVWSQWMLAVRKGQLKEYIPESLLPKDPKTGMVLRRNDFDVSFIMTENDMSEDGKNKIQTTQGNIQHEGLLQSYITALDLCLQGLISPSTLGIDVKKMDNAEAQREKEKTTLYRRNQIVNKLEKVIKEIVDVVFKTKDTMENKNITDVDVSVTFGGYANPSFEAQVETVGKASTTHIMSIDAQVEELWGDTKDKEWKIQEVKKIKEEQGIIPMEEPAINNDLDLVENEDVLEK